MISYMRIYIYTIKTHKENTYIYKADFRSLNGFLSGARNHNRKYCASDAGFLTVVAPAITADLTID